MTRAKNVVGLVAFLLLCSPLQTFAEEPLNVAVAANMKYAFDDLAAAFTQRSGIKVAGIASSSGKLTAQIESGAPFDVFLSADMEYPRALERDGYTASPPEVYAYGTLVLWTAGALDLSPGLAVLQDAAVHKVAIANPRVAPYGRAALEALEHQGLRAQVEPKLVYGESIGQVNQYIDSGAAEVGFTAKSIVLTPEFASKGRWIEVPADSYAPIAQGMVILKHATGEGARRFGDFVRSDEGRAILQRYGYRLP